MHKKAYQEDEPDQSKLFYSFVIIFLNKNLLFSFTVKKKYYHDDKIKSKRSNGDKLINIIASPLQAKKVTV